VLEGCCAATIITANGNATFHLWQLYAAAVQEDHISEDVSPETLVNLVVEGQAKNNTTKEVYTVLGCPGGYSAEKPSVSATLLCQYESHWQQHNSFPYYQMQLYIPTDGWARTEVLCHHYDDPIAGHFGTRRTLELVARKYDWPSMVRKVKAYTRACLTCQLVRPVRHRPHGSMEPLPQLWGPWKGILVDFIVGIPVSRWKRHAKPQNTVLIVINQYTKQTR
jgi:hypothetical protein